MITKNHGQVLKDLEDRRDYSNVVLDSGYSPLKIFLDLCFCAYYMSFFSMKVR